MVGKLNVYDVAVPVKTCGRTIGLNPLDPEYRPTLKPAARDVCVEGGGGSVFVQILNVGRQKGEA
jgi:hypothetical protein